jgi:hypothetical protein
MKGGGMSNFKLHPIVRVNCDDNGIIYYERLGTTPIMLRIGEPAQSRAEAQRRCIALLEGLPRNRPEMRFTKISNTVEGLTYEELRIQTIVACDMSLKVEANKPAKKAKKRRGRGY